MAIAVKAPIHRLVLALLGLWTFLLGQSRGLPLPKGSSDEDRPGADVFVTSPVALLREKPSASGRVLERLPAGTRLSLRDVRNGFLRVETVGEQPGSAQAAPTCVLSGYLASETTAVFAPESRGTSEMLVVGRVLARNPAYRRLAAALLLRGTERSRAEGTEDPLSEVVLGEAAEALAAAGGPLPAGLETAARVDSKSGKARLLYTGQAFERALAAASGQGQGGEDLQAERERALAGMLRAQFPDSGASLISLWQETAAWLALVETAHHAAVLRSGGDRLGTASLALGRFLLAAGRLEDLRTLESRVRGAGERLLTLLPEKTDGSRLRSRADLLRAMRGDASRPFPQEARIRLAKGEIMVRIEGELGALCLVMQQTGDRARRRSAVPILPVPGSLRVAPDGGSAAWIEVAGPAALIPVVTSLTKDEPAREVAFLASGRPLRDRKMRHILSSLRGFSRDGRRLGLSIKAWDETPGPSPRLSIVNVATGELLYETSAKARRFRRLLD